MKRIWLLMCCIVGCAEGSGAPSPPADASAEPSEEPLDASTDGSVDSWTGPCGPGACGPFTGSTGETINCGACPEGETCGDNGQPNICGNRCSPKSDPVACNDMLTYEGFSTGQLLEYFADCSQDPPIDQNNCVPWKIWDPGGYPRTDTDTAYCCLPPAVGEGDDAGMGDDAGDDAGSAAASVATPLLVYKIHSHLIGRWSYTR